MNNALLEKSIRNIPDFPKPGILFRDVTTLIQNKEAFKKSRDGGLVKFLLKHRHLYTNIFITTQYINAITPVIKNNIDIFCLFNYANINYMRFHVIIIFPDIFDSYLS